MTLTEKARVFEHLIEDLIDQNYGVTTDFLAAETITGLRSRLEDHFRSHNLHPAGIGKEGGSRQNPTIRGDRTLWIEPDTSHPAERDFLEQLHAFISYLNRTCYAGIRDFEFHYALYPPGAFYRRHLDRFHLDGARKFSLITYLNADWSETDGGALVMYVDDTPRTLFPYGGQTVFFKSDVLEHEVLPALRPRFSITGWLKG